MEHEQHLNPLKQDGKLANQIDIPMAGFNAETVSQELIVCLARTVLDRLEEVEREGGLDRIDLTAPQLVDDETRSLVNGFKGLKARLKWIAEGM